MFFLDKDKELTEARILKYIQKFNFENLPMLLKYKDYYDGVQEISSKTVNDNSKPCNKLVCNYCSDIVENYNGYLIGKPVAYSSNDDISDLLNVLRYNDSVTEDKDFLRNALIYGVAYELNYIDEEGMQRFKVINSTQGFPIYSNSLNDELIAFVRIYSANDIDDTQKAYIDIYTDKEIKHYNSTIGFDSLSLVSVENHFYGQVPVTVLQLNNEEKSIFDKILTLQDAYNKLISAHTDDYEAFVDAYMVLKGLTADDDDLAKMKENRILLLDNDSEATYLTKQGDSNIINELLKNINDHIQRIAKCPDFTDEKFLAQSGIAIRFKMCGMENNASNIESNMKKALTKRLELICAIESLTADELVWRDIRITFTRNIPVNNLEQAQLVNQLRGLVSTKTLLSQLPFIEDAQAEVEAVAKENDISLYNYGGEE